MTTGYGWKVNTDAGKDNVSYTEADKSENTGSYRLGAGGHKEILITAEHAGEFDFQATNVRHWEFNGWDGETGGIMDLDLKITVTGPAEAKVEEPKVEEPKLVVNDKPAPVYNPYSRYSGYRGGYRTGYQQRPQYGG